jgi:hypothetical protein
MTFAAKPLYLLKYAEQSYSVYRKKLLSIVTWVFLARVRNSLASKSLSMLSISALVLSNIPNVLIDIGVTTWTIVCIYLGSIIFLSGYILFYLYSPSEFKSPGDMIDHISRMQVLCSQKFLSNRLLRAKIFADRASGNENVEIPAGILESLKKTVDYFEKIDPDKRVSEAQQLFQDDLAAREHDAPNKRLKVALLLASGSFLIVLPTMVNVLVSLWRLIL